MKLQISTTIRRLRGGATDFKVGVQNRIRERSERKKNFVPPLFQIWGTRKQISVGACWIISLYKNSSVLISPGSSSLNISANMAKWHSSSTSTNELSRSLGYESTSVLAALWNSSGDRSNDDRQLKHPNQPASIGLELNKSWA